MIKLLVFIFHYIVNQSTDCLQFVKNKEIDKKIFVLEIILICLFFSAVYIQIQSNMEPQRDIQQNQHPKQQQQIKQHQEQISKIIVYPSTLDWRLQQFDPYQSLKQVTTFAEGQVDTLLKVSTDISIKVSQAGNKGSGLSKYIAYILKIKDKQGQYEILRRYSDFDLLHRKLILRWPGIYIPSIPNKTIMNNKDKQVINNRMRFLNNFLRKISSIPAIYYGQQFQIFLKSNEVNVQKALEQIKALNFDELFNKYEQNFPQHKKQIGQQDIKKIFQSEGILLDQKVQLVNFKNQMRKLAEIRLKYKLCEKNIFVSLLENYENTMNDWFTEDSKDINIRYYSKEGYKNQLQQTDNIWQDNPFWHFYDIFKFQLRQIDALLVVIQKCKEIRSQKRYLQRTKQVNNQTINLVTDKKSSFKAFIMGGSQQDKKTKLTNEIHECEKRLITINSLYEIILNIAQDSMRLFHQQRAQFYNKCIRKIAKDQAKIIQKALKFHIKQLQFNPEKLSQ